MNRPRTIIAAQNLRVFHLVQKAESNLLHLCHGGLAKDADPHLVNGRPAHRGERYQ